MNTRPAESKAPSHIEPGHLSTGGGTTEHPSWAGTSTQHPTPIHGTPPHKRGYPPQRAGVQQSGTPTAWTHPPSPMTGPGQQWPGAHEGQPWGGRATTAQGATLSRPNRRKRQAQALRGPGSNPGESTNAQRVGGEGVATSRTGTGKWQRIRKEMLKQAHAAGITRCPLCGNSFDWTRSRVARSPEVDHIVPHSMGGRDSIENSRLICRDCNAKRGGQLGRARRARRLANLKSVELETSTEW